MVSTVYDSTQLSYVLYSMLSSVRCPVCLDIDECKIDNDCVYTCTNTAGDYECSCPVGMHGSENNCSGLFILTLVYNIVITF